MSPAGHTAREGLKPVSTPQGFPLPPATQETACLFWTSSYDLKFKRVESASPPPPTPPFWAPKAYGVASLNTQAPPTLPDHARRDTPALDHTHSLQQTCESGSPRAPNCFTRLRLVPGRHPAYSKAWWMTSIRIIRKWLLSGSLFCTFIQKTHWILNSKRQYHLPLMENLQRSLPTARIWGETFEKTQPMRLRIAETGRGNKQSR